MPRIIIAVVIPEMRISCGRDDVDAGTIVGAQTDSELEAYIDRLFPGRKNISVTKYDRDIAEKKFGYPFAGWCK